MLRPVDRSMTVSAPHRVAHTILSTSSSIEEVTAELPMLALILVRKLRPMIIGSDSGWFTLAGMTARPSATSVRTKSASSPSRSAMYSISGVTTPARAYASWVTARSPVARRGRRAGPSHSASSDRRSVALRPSSSGRTSRPEYSSVSPRPAIHASRTAGRPRRTWALKSCSVYGPEVSYSTTVSPVLSATSRIGTRRSGWEPWRYTLRLPRRGPAVTPLLGVTPLLTVVIPDHSLRRHYPEQVQRSVALHIPWYSHPLSPVGPSSRG